MTGARDIRELPDWRGFHHLAIATADFDATLRFYGDVLGMQVGEIVPAAGQRSRHVFVKPGAGDSWGIHLWEHADAPRRTPPTEWSAESINAYGFEWGALNHIAFALPDEAAAELLRARLEAHGVRATPFNSVGPIRNMLFFDNNGIMLEATWPRVAALEVVAAWQNAANARDAARLTELSSDDIEIVGPRGTGRGSRLLREWLARAGLELTTLRSWASGATVVLEQHGVWRDVETGEPRGEANVASLFRVVDGRVAYFARFDSAADALAAAELDAATHRV